jgi:hypothetical protein
MKQYFIPFVITIIGCSTPDRPSPEWQAEWANDALFQEQLAVETDFENSSIQ